MRLAAERSLRTTALSMFVILLTFTIADAMAQPILQNFNGLWSTNCAARPRAEWGLISVVGDIIQFDWPTNKGIVTERVTNIAGNTIKTVLISSQSERFRPKDTFIYVVDGQRISITNNSQNITQVIERCN